MLELIGEQRIEAPRQKVWDALNNPKILKACIPGCESLEPHGENGFESVVVAKVGPVKARFTGTVELSNIKPPESYTISGEGKGGAAGMAKGGADVVLEEDGDNTLLKYTVRADVGGKLAAIGSRLIKSTAQKYAADFFSQFGGYATGAVPLPEDVPTAAAAASVAAAPVPGSPMPGFGADENATHIRRLNWAMLAIIVGLLTYILATS